MSKRMTRKTKKKKKKGEEKTLSETWRSNYLFCCDIARKLQCVFLCEMICFGSSDDESVRACGAVFFWGWSSRLKLARQIDLMCTVWWRKCCSKRVLLFSVYLSVPCDCCCCSCAELHFCVVVANWQFFCHRQLLLLLLLPPLLVFYSCCCCFFSFLSPLSSHHCALQFPQQVPLLQHFCQIREQYFRVATLMVEVVLLLIIAFGVFCCRGCSTVVSLFLHRVFPCLCALTNSVGGGEKEEGTKSLYCWLGPTRTHAM